MRCGCGPRLSPACAGLTASTRPSLPLVPDMAELERSTIRPGPEVEPSGARRSSRRHRFVVKTEAPDEGIEPLAGEQHALGGTAAVGARRATAKCRRLGIAVEAATRDPRHVRVRQKRA